MHYGLAVQQGHLTLFLEPHETFLQNAFCYLAVIERVVVCFIAALVQLYGTHCMAHIGLLLVCMIASMKVHSITVKC